MGAVVDCELIRDGLFGQPVNTLTTPAFVLAGGWLMTRARTRWVGVALIATGLGSFVFHGPMPPWGEWTHDVTLGWLIAVIGGLNTRWEPWSRLPALAVIAAVLALIPSLGDPLALGLAAGVIVSIVYRKPAPGELAPLALLAVVAVLGRLGATGGPLCDPASVWQLHGLWHVGAATAVAWWAARVTGDEI